MKKVLILVAFILVSCMCASAVDMALYVGRSNDGWYAPAQVRPDGKTIAKGVNGLKDIQLFGDGDDLKKLPEFWRKILGACLCYSESVHP